MEETKNVPVLRFSEFSKNWEIKKLEEVGNIITGNTPTTSNKEYYGGNKLFVTPADIEHNRYISKTKTTLTSLGFSKGRLIKKNSILFVCIGSTIGKLIQVTEECITNQQINSIIVFDKFSDDFVYSLLEFNAIKIKNLAGVQAVPLINKTTFSKIKLHFPSFNEQSKIAEFLSEVDKKIELLSKKKKGLEDYKKGIMQKIFNQEIRFKDENGNDYPDWEEKNLGDLATISTGNKDTQNRTDTGKYPFFVRSQTVERINSYSYNGEAILTSGDGVGVGKNYHYINGKFNFHQRVYCINEFNKEVNGKYIFYFFSTHFYERVIRLSAKNSVDSVRREMVTKMKIKIPSFKEQIKIANVIGEFDKKISQIDTKLEEMKQFKKGLLQQMFV